MEFVICERCGNIIPEGEVQCRVCGMQYDAESMMIREKSKELEEKENQRTQDFTIFGIDWVDFIIWIQLIFIIFRSVIEGIWLLTKYRKSMIGDDMQELLYNTHESQIFITIYGIIWLIFAAFAVVVRVRLQQMKRSGLIMYSVLMALGILNHLIGCIGVAIIISVSFWNVCFWSMVDIGMYFIFFVFSILYYKKEKNLFADDIRG